MAIRAGLDDLALLLVALAAGCTLSTTRLDDAGSESDACGACGGDEGGVLDAGDQLDACGAEPLVDIGVPPDARPAASRESMGSVAALAIDSDATTAWSSGELAAVFHLDFVTPTAFAGIQLAASARPETTVHYRIQGGTMDSAGTIGEVTLTVPAVPTDSSPRPPLPPIAVPLATYRWITIFIDSSSSIELAEVSLLASACR